MGLVNKLKDEYCIVASLKLAIKQAQTTSGRMKRCFQLDGRPKVLQLKVGRNARPK
jgi:hypothetical protein